MEYVSNEVLDWVIAENEKAIGNFKAQGRAPPANLVGLQQSMAHTANSGYRTGIVARHFLSERRADAWDYQKRCYGIAICVWDGLAVVKTKCRRS